MNRPVTTLVHDFQVVNRPVTTLVHDFQVVNLAEIAGKSRELASAEAKIPPKVVNVTTLKKRSRLEVVNFTTLKS